jgi:hypothetical protein
MNRRSMFILSAVAALALSQPARAADPTIDGTWELNVAASKSTDPMPKSITRTYVTTGNQEKLTGTIVTADGKSIPISFTATIDGKDYPFQNPGADTLAITKVDALTHSFVVKKDGKVVTTGTRTIAKDGKTMTLAAKGTNAEGKPVESTMVYDRK